MQSDIKTKALVLRRTNYGEADRIVNFITPEGKISAIAKGVRKEKSKLAGGMELFSLIQINIHQGKNEMGVVTSAKMLKFYSALLNMKMTENEVEVENLVDYITTYLGEQGSDYVVIETGSSSRLMMELDEDVRTNWFNQKFKGADYKHYDLSVGWYLSDIEEIESYNETVVIIKKKDLPFVESTVTPGEPDVSFTEESNMEKGYAYVRLTINPNLIAKYSKDAEVMRLKIVSKGMGRY